MCTGTIAPWSSPQLGSGSLWVHIYRGRKAARLVSVIISKKMIRCEIIFFYPLAQTHRPNSHRRRAVTPVQRGISYDCFIRVRRSLSRFLYNIIIVLLPYYSIIIYPPIGGGVGYRSICAAERMRIIYSVWYYT